MIYYLADTLIDGSGEPARRMAAIAVENGKITAVLAQADIPTGAQVVSRPGMTVIPGMIDPHTHIMFGDGPRTYLDVINNDSNGLILVRAARNAYQHMRSGVTLMRDSGASQRIGFDIKAGSEQGFFLSPRIQVCGRPVTMTGGHFYFCGEEADGLDNCRRAARRVLKEGADFIKIMSGGGGLTPNSDDTRPSYSVEEMRVIVEEAHAAGKTTEAHCLAFEGLRRAAEAGIDILDHINFILPGGIRRFDEGIAGIILKKGLTVCPTISTGYRKLEDLRAKGSALSPREQTMLDELNYKLETKLSFVNKFHRMGVNIIAGTDATNIFGDYAINLELLCQAGLTPMETIVAATSRAAQAIGAGDQLGTLKPGMLADFVYLDGDPLQDISRTNAVETVVLGGRIVVDRPGERAVAAALPFAAHPGKG